MFWRHLLNGPAYLFSGERLIQIYFQVAYTSTAEVGPWARVGNIALEYDIRVLEHKQTSITAGIQLAK